MTLNGLQNVKNGRYRVEVKTALNTIILYEMCVSLKNDRYQPKLYGNTQHFTACRHQSGDNPHPLSTYLFQVSARSCRAPRNNFASRFSLRHSNEKQEEGKLSHFFQALMLHGDIFGIEVYS